MDKIHCICSVSLTPDDALHAQVCPKQILWASGYCQTLLWNVMWIPAACLSNTNPQLISLSPDRYLFKLIDIYKLFGFANTFF